jgi:hypothetical protein
MGIPRILSVIPWRFLITSLHSQEIQPHSGIPRHSPAFPGIPRQLLFAAFMSARNAEGHTCSEIDLLKPNLGTLFVFYLYIEVKNKKCSFIGVDVVVNL